MEKDLEFVILHEIWTRRAMDFESIQMVYDELKSIDDTIKCIDYSISNSLNVLDCAKTKIFIA